MFGRSLEETMRVESRLGGTYIPILIHRCVKFIRENGETLYLLMHIYYCAHKTGYNHSNYNKILKSHANPCPPPPYENILYETLHAHTLTWVDREVCVLADMEVCVLADMEVCVLADRGKFLATGGIALCVTGGFKGQQLVSYQ